MISSSTEFDLETVVRSFTAATSYRYILTVERYYVTMLEQDVVETRTFNVKAEGMSPYEKYATLMGSYEYTQVDVQKVSFRFNPSGELYEAYLEISTDALDLIITYKFSEIGTTTVDLPIGYS